MWQTISVRETCERLKTNSVNGLTKDEAEERIKKYGEWNARQQKQHGVQSIDMMISLSVLIADLQKAQRIA